MIIDFIQNVYQYGKCDSIYTELDLSSDSADQIEELNRKLPYFIAYKVLSAIPLFIFSSFIVIDLIYKAMINLFDFIIRNGYYWTRSQMLEKARDSFFCLLLNVDDDHEIIYTKHDLDYVFDLFNKEKLIKKSIYDDNQRVNTNKIDILPNLELAFKQKYSKKARIQPKTFFLIKLVNKIYPIDPNFRFTSKFCNTIIVALVALYYTCLLAYYFSILITFLTKILPENIDFSQPIEINIGDIGCILADEFCI